MLQFALCGHRVIQSANFCLFDKPCIHPSRTMEVHDFIYMIDGEWKIGIGKENFEMHAGDVLILPANRAHYGITPCAPKTRTMYFCIYSHPDDNDYNQQPADDRVVVKKFLNASKAPNIKRLFERILQTQSEQKICTAYINTLLYELSEISAESSSHSLARAIHDYIVYYDSHRIPTNSEVATRFNVSKRTAETIFKNCYHTTIHQCILTHKLNESKRYLLDYPDMKIISIANALGFYDEFHFSKAFKKAFGISPSGFRKQNRG